MAEYVTLPARGTKVAVDIIADEVYQRVKTTWGADGASVDASVTNPLPVQEIKTLTMAAGEAHAIVTGATSVVVVTGPCKGGYLTNPPSAAAQGISDAENLYVDPVSAPTALESDANGTMTMLVPGQNYDIPVIASGQYLRANAATSGHKFTVVVFR